MKNVTGAGLENFVDVAALTKRFAGRFSLLRQIAGLFERQALESADELRRALAEGDAQRVRETAHGLVNAGGAVYSTPLVEAARRLEDAARGGDLEASAVLSAVALRLAEGVAVWLRRHVETLERDGGEGG